MAAKKILSCAAFTDAHEYAAKKHRKQRYGPHPYIYHLEQVHQTARGYGLNADICTAALLHDILEDTDVTSIELHTFFGPAVAGLVQLVTDEPGKNRKERAAKTWPKIRTDAGAVALKLCDRLANVMACINRVGNANLLEMYRKEHEAFKEALYADDDDEVILLLWDTLDTLIKQEPKR